VTLLADDPERPAFKDSTARIVSRFKRESESAKTIVYDTKTKSVYSDRSTGGTFQGPPQQPKPATAAAEAAAAAGADATAPRRSARRGGDPSAVTVGWVEKR